MREALAEIVRQTAPLFDKIRVTGLDTGLKVEAHSEDKMLFLIGDLKEPINELAGEFGIGNLGLLHGLLNFPSYKADNAKFDVRRTERNGVNFVSEFEFRDAQGGHSRFRTMNPNMVSDQAKIQTIPWDVEVTPNKAKITELIQLAGLLSEVDKHFSVQIEDGTLILTLGGKGAASHTASVALATDVIGKLPASNAVFKAPLFLQALKAGANYPMTIRFSARSIGGITVNTEKGTYQYILRATEG